MWSLSCSTTAQPQTKGGDGSPEPRAISCSPLRGHRTPVRQDPRAPHSRGGLCWGRDPCLLSLPSLQSHPHRAADPGLLVTVASLGKRSGRVQASSLFLKNLRPTSRGQQPWSESWHGVGRGQGGRVGTRLGRCSASHRERGGLWGQVPAAWRAGLGPQGPPAFGCCVATEAAAQSSRLHGPCPDTQQVAALTTYSEIQAYPGTTWPRAHTAPGHSFSLGRGSSDLIPALEMFKAPSCTPAVSLSKRPCVHSLAPPLRLLVAVCHVPCGVRGCSLAQAHLPLPEGALGHYAQPVRNLRAHVHNRASQRGEDPGLPLEAGCSFTRPLGPAHSLHPSFPLGFQGSPQIDSVTQATHLGLPLGVDGGCLAEGALSIGADAQAARGGQGVRTGTAMPLLLGTTK
ncbi:hypothetical protein H8959_006721 [Pygathrix nigripes]